MYRCVLVPMATILLAANGASRRPAAQALAPAVDHHQHIFSANAAALAQGIRPMDAANLIALLDTRHPTCRRFIDGVRLTYD